MKSKGTRVRRGGATVVVATLLIAMMSMGCENKSTTAAVPMTEQQVKELTHVLMEH